MKVLTATSKTQGTRRNDFCWTVEGELVVFPPIECGRETVDGGCGCKRSLAGLASHRATTTVAVTDRDDLTYPTYRALIIDGLTRQGYLDQQLLRDDEVQEWVEDTMRELVAISSAFRPGTVLERRGNWMSVRHAPGDHDG